jgi:hypothetical protein
MIENRVDLILLSEQAQTHFRKHSLCKMARGAKSQCLFFKLIKKTAVTLSISPNTWEFSAESTDQ